MFEFDVKIKLRIREESYLAKFWNYSALASYKAMLTTLAVE